MPRIFLPFFLRVRFFTAAPLVCCASAAFCQLASITTCAIGSRHSGHGRHSRHCRHGWQRRTTTRAEITDADAAVPRGAPFPCTPPCALLPGRQLFRTSTASANICIRGTSEYSELTSCANGAYEWNYEWNNLGTGDTSDTSDTNTRHGNIARYNIRGNIHGNTRGNTSRFRVSVDSGFKTFRRAGRICSICGVGVVGGIGGVVDQQHSLGAFRRCADTKLTA